MPQSATLRQVPEIELVSPTSAGEIESARALFREYAAGLGIDLSFQGFEQELATLPGEYAAPRGALLLALVDGVPVGCCALRPLMSDSYPGACEMKRLYVRKTLRGLGLGRQLAEAIIEAARLAGYDALLLDTLDDMEAARTLYQDLGFEEVPPYYLSEIAGAHYLKLDLN